MKQRRFHNHRPPAGMEEKKKAIKGESDRVLLSNLTFCDIARPFVFAELWGCRYSFSFSREIDCGSPMFCVMF
jgi:hypothetical protein